MSLSSTVWLYPMGKAALNLKKKNLLCLAAFIIISGSSYDDIRVGIPGYINIVHQTLLENKDMVTMDQVSGIMVIAFIMELRGSSNKEWDFFYSALNLHARLMKSCSKLTHLFGCSRVPYLTCYVVPTVVAR